MGKRDLAEALRQVRCFLLDMDGTFYLGDQVLSGSLDFLQKVSDTGRSVLFVTNNSSKSAQAYVRKLEGMGVPALLRQVLTSGQVAGRYALTHHRGQKGFVLGTPMLCQELASMGVSQDVNNPDYVLVGYDTTITYAKMTRVCDLLRAGLPYIATHPDKNCPTREGFAPDIGAIMAFIEASTGRQPDVILGKPYGGIVEECLRTTGLRPESLAVVGDRLYTDIATGVNFGIASILVLSGETRQEDIPHSPVQPDFVVERLSTLIEYL